MIDQWALLVVWLASILWAFVAGRGWEIYKQRKPEHPEEST